ncbi:hypothetical protein RvY_13175 [Ramazzottius varieornatus]|uniref:Uncharacterized protein n=1 Tax=Ramazzottius varieornatus TaxID=947166 RepID=A0A1D1VP79_RAMVA|nr:hypothetical protein RvY_13175 [Ramazzottius varieornatus]
MPELPRKKLLITNGTVAVKKESPVVGSAIVFWHEAEGSPPAVKTISLRDLEPLSVGSVVTEKTICRAYYRGEMYNCIVIWIEDDKTPDELASMRLFPAASERTYEDKGYRWAEELGINLRGARDDDATDGTDDWAFSADQQSFNEESPSMLVDNCTTSSLLASGSDFHDAMRSPNEQLTKRKNGSVGSYEDLSAQVVEMRDTIAALRQQNPTQAAASHLPTFLNYNGRRNLSPEDQPISNASAGHSPSGPSSVSGPVPAGYEELFDMMLQQSTWKKALKLGMKKTFTIEELITSVPTERGARMSKQGKKALDQEKLAVVKSLVQRYCVQKDVWQPSNELVHQELGGILFSVREASNPTAKAGKVQIKKESLHFGHFRPIPRKGSVGPRPYSFKMPSFATAMDLSEARSTKPSD